MHKRMLLCVIIHRWERVYFLEGPTASAISAECLKMTQISYVGQDRFDFYLTE